MENRYAGKPLLRLIECYVLDAIEQLEPNHATVLQRMEPKLGETYGMKGTWQEIVAAQMAFPDSLPSKIKTLWERQREQSSPGGRMLAPSDFAVEFVNQNFPEAIAPRNSENSGSGLKS